jgi:hypothetical protein
MKLSLRILLTLTVIIIMGIITFIKIMTQPVFPMIYFIIWIVVSVILTGLTVGSWLRNKQRQ